MSEQESKPAKVEDLEKPVTDKNAEQVKGGMSSGGGTGSPVLVKPIKPRAAEPCW